MPLPELMPFCSVTNANFGRVLSVVNKHLKASKSHPCACGKCANRIIAEALNSLPTHYFAEKDRESGVGSPWILVESAVTEAMERFHQAPCSREP